MVGDPVPVQGGLEVQKPSILAAAIAQPLIP